jgi:hypothetical protein
LLPAGGPVGRLGRLACYRAGGAVGAVGGPGESWADRHHVRVVPSHAAVLYGEMTRNIMDVIRGASKPLSVMQAVNAIVARRGLASGDGGLIEALRKRVGWALRTCKTRDTATSAREQGLQLVWRLA